MNERWLHRVGWALVAGLAGAMPTLALSDSVGEAGIDARRLQEAPWFLTGRKIAIGQVEIGRPGKFGLDKAAASLAGLRGVRRVFDRDESARPDLNVDSHATMVAAVMVGRDKRLGGVAPGARLYAAAVGAEVASQSQECLASQFVALQNSGDVRAINFSFGESLQRDRRRNALLDGNALLTLCVDWSARTHNVLYTVAGNQGAGGIPIPTDQYNGIVVAYTARQALEQPQFSRLDFANLSARPEGIGRRIIAREINVGPRRAVSLVAPGGSLAIPELEGRVGRPSGTSFAAPHVTATVALLQEYGDRRWRDRDDSQPWSLDSRRHEVMKAVLLNSAEKLEGVLGARRTVFGRRDRHTWQQSEAFGVAAIPLDLQLGAGQLDAHRALEQFAAGPQAPRATVPLRGWDYGTISRDKTLEYQLAEPLTAGSFVSVTVAWDRHVELVDLNGNDRFDLGEDFRDRGLNDLNLYLVPADGATDRQAVCASTSAVDSVEHIFCPVPETGRYKIRLHYAKRAHASTQAYGLAWWAESQPGARQPEASGEMP